MRYTVQGEAINFVFFFNAVDIEKRERERNLKEKSKITLFLKNRHGRDSARGQPVEWER